MSKNIPPYYKPCLVLSPTIPPTLYLIGVTDFPKPGTLEVNSINLSNIDNATFTLKASLTNPERWSSSAPKLCSNYAGATLSNSAGEAVPLRLHIQQFTKDRSFDVNVLPDGNNTLGGSKGSFEVPQNGDRLNSFLSPNLFAIVGQVGDQTYAMAKTDISGAPWGAYTVEATSNVTSSLLGAAPEPPSNSASLVVGTFETKATFPVNGNIAAFEPDGSSGQLHSTQGFPGNTIKVVKTQPIQMNGFKLTQGAIPVHMGAAAFILDQDTRDNSVIIYTINPGKSPALKRIQASSSVPQFNVSMVASATESQIIIYSIQKDGPAFNIFDIAGEKWSGPGLSAQMPPTSGGNGDGGNGTDSGNSSSGKSNGAIIGGAVAGVLVLVLIAAFFIVRRKRQRRGRGRSSQKHSSLVGGAAGGGGSGGSSDLGAEEREENKPVLSDYQQQQNRASLNMVDSSRGSILTLNSSSTAPLTYAPHRSSTRPLFGQSQPEQPTSAPLTVPQQLQLQQQQIQQQQQLQQQQARRGATTQGTEVLSLPAILEQHPFELHGSEADEEQLRKLEQESPYVARPYSNVPSFSYPSVYQDGPRHSHQPVRTTVINPYSGASVVDDEEQEPYVLPDPIIVAPTPMPHKAELLD